MAVYEEGFFEDWPKWSKPILALSGMILLGGVWIGIPLLSAWKLVENRAGVDYEPMMAVLIAMTTATITGIFVFMTFRIDRGTRLKAERVVKDNVNKLVQHEFSKFEKNSKNQLEEFATESKGKLDTFDEISRGKLNSFDVTLKEKIDEFDKISRTKFGEIERKVDESTRPEAIKEEIRRRISEEAFRGHVEAVLLANANGQIVKEYARERAASMDAKSVEALLSLLKETIEHLARYVEDQHEEDRDSPWSRAKATMAGWWRRRR